MSFFVLLTKKIVMPKDEFLVTIPCEMKKVTPTFKNTVEECVFKGAYYAAKYKILIQTLSCVTEGRISCTSQTAYCRKSASARGRRNPSITTT